MITLRSLCLIPAVSSLAVACPVQAADDPVRWSAQLDSDNTDWVQVDVDLRGLADDSLITNVQVSVAFYGTGGHRLGDKSLPFTDADGTLQGGNYYRRFFRTGSDAARRAQGLQLLSTLRTRGSFYDLRLGSGHQGTPAASGPWMSRPHNVAASSSAPPPTGQLAMIGPTPFRQVVLHLPEDGVRNNNQSIGPFCCTGTTAIVRDTAGRPVGYVYSFDFSDAYILSAQSSAASTLSVLLSADNPAGGEQLQGKAEFAAAMWQPGATRTVRLGRLTYSVNLIARTIAMGDATRFDMGSAEATVRVSGAD